ncbi:hypothetical protein OROGR_030699 [Orobanche gracilis]
MAEYEAHLKKRAWLIVSDPSLNEFVSNRQFVLDHLSKLDEFRDCLVICAPYNAISYFSLSGLMKIGELDLPDQFYGMMCEYVGDVDGIVCFLLNGLHLALFNPVLQRWNIPTQIPELPVEEVTHSCYGFGKDLAGDYKIVRLRERLQLSKRKAREVAVFSCSSRTWSVNCQRFPNNITPGRGQCVDSVLYFLCSALSNLKERVSEKLVIFAINLSDLTNAQLELPTKCSDDQAYYLWLVTLHDCLGLVQINTSDERDWGKKIWSMQPSGEWTVMFTLPSDDFGSLKCYLPLRNELIMVEPQVDGSFIVYFLDAINERKLERKLKVDLDDVDSVDTCYASLVSPS